MDSPWENFPYSELRCHCGRCDSDGSEISPELMDRIQALRNLLGFPLPLSSAYRCHRHPAEAKKDEPGTHHLGLAVDIKVSRQRAHQVLTAALRMGCFTGIGINQKGGGRFIHLDIASTAANRPRPHVWSY